MIWQKTELQFRANFEFPPEVLGHHLHSRFKLSTGNTGLQPRQHADIFAAAHRPGNERQRRPNIRCARVGRTFISYRIEVARHHPNHSEWLTVQQNGFAYPVGVASQPAHPNSIANDCDALAITAILFVQKVAAEHWVNSQNSKILGVHWHAAQMFRGIPRSQVVTNLRVARDVLKGFTVSAKAIQLLCCQALLIHQFLVAFSEHHNALGFREWQRTKQDAVNDRKDGGVRANPQRERQHGDDRKARRVTQYAESVADVLPESCHEAPAVAKHMSVSIERFSKKWMRNPVVGSRQALYLYLVFPARGDSESETWKGNYSREETLTSWFGRGCRR